MNHSSDKKTLLAQTLGAVDGGYVARGIAIDDDEQGLLNSIEDYSTDYSVPIEIHKIASSAKTGFLLENMRTSDFMIIDHRLQGKFVGYSDGLEIVEAIRAINSRVPIFYYTAYEQDLYVPATRRRNTFNERAMAVLRQPWTYFFEKNELQPDLRLPEFAHLIYWTSIGYALETIRSPLTDDLIDIVTSNELRSETRRFKLLGRSVAGLTRIQEISSSQDSIEDTVPTRLLRNAGIKEGQQYVDHKVMELENGYVLSYFKKATLVGQEIPEDVIKIIEEVTDD